MLADHCVNVHAYIQDTALNFENYYAWKPLRYIKVIKVIKKLTDCVEKVIIIKETENYRHV